MVDAAVVISAIASLVTAVVVVAGFWSLSRRVDKAETEVQAGVAKVAHQVTTGNGQTLAMLAEAVEGRRIRTDVPTEVRSPAEQHYVAGIPDDSQPTT